MDKNPFEFSPTPTVGPALDGTQKRHAYALMMALFGGLTIGALMGALSSGSIGYIFIRVVGDAVSEPWILVVGGVITGMFLGAPMGVFSGCGVLFWIFWRDLPTDRVTMPNALGCALFGGIMGVLAVLYLVETADSGPGYLYFTSGLLGFACGGAGGWLLAYAVGRVYRG